MSSNDLHLAGNPHPLLKIWCGKIDLNLWILLDLFIERLYSLGLKPETGLIRIPHATALTLGWSPSTVAR